MLSLKSGVFYSSMPDGAVIRGGKEPLIIKGQRSYELVDAVLRVLRKGVERDNLVEAFPPIAVPAVKQLLSQLQEHNLLRQRALRDPEPDPQCAKQFSQVWSYLADCSSEPGRNFNAWTSELFSISGNLASALLSTRALAELGARRFELVFNDVPNDEAVRLFRDQYPTLQLEIVSERSIEAMSILADFGEYTERPLVPQSGWYVGSIARHALFGYVPGNMSSTLKMWSETLKPIPDLSPAAGLSPQRMALASSHLAFALFKTFCGVEPVDEYHQPRAVLYSGNLSKVTPPRGPSITQSDLRFSGAIPSDVSASPENQEFFDVLAPLFHPISGFMEVIERDHPQVPLFLLECQVQPTPNSEPQIALGWGMTLFEAKLRAAQQGIALYLAARLQCSAANVVVEFSDGKAMKRARALQETWATNAIVEGAWKPIVPNHRLSNTTFKMWRLLALLSKEEPRVEALQGVGGSGWAVRLHHSHSLSIETYAAELDEAVYLALGKRCAAVQVELPVEIAPTQALLQQGNSEGVRILKIDVGYHDLAQHVSCLLVAH